jgi:hypothetical protein
MLYNFLEAQGGRIAEDRMTLGAVCELVRGELQTSIPKLTDAHIKRGLIDLGIKYAKIANTGGGQTRRELKELARVVEEISRRVGRLQERDVERLKQMDTLLGEWEDFHNGAVGRFDQFSLTLTKLTETLRAVFHTVYPNTSQDQRNRINNALGDLIKVIPRGK